MVFAFISGDDNGAILDVNVGHFQAADLYRADKTVIDEIAGEEVEPIVGAQPFGYLADNFQRNDSATLFVEPLTDGLDAVGRFRLEIALLHEEPGKDTKEVEVVVASLSTIVTVYKYVV